MTETRENETTKDSRRAQMFIGAVVWTAAGIMLFSMGLFWMTTGVYGWLVGLLAAIPAVLVGMAKGHFLLDRVSRRSILRIVDRGPEAPVWSFYGVKTWLLVGVMMGSGIGLRLLFNTEHWSFFYLGLLYVAVGVALVLASRRMWAAVAGGAAAVNTAA